MSSLAHPADDLDVVITRTEFVEPGRPTALAKCSAKEELLARHRAKLDVTDYTNLSIGEIIPGYVNQVHSSRDLEIDMVKQIQHKSEVPLYCLLHNPLYHTLAPKSATYDRICCRLIFRLTHMNR